MKGTNDAAIALHPMRIMEELLPWWDMLDWMRLSQQRLTID